MTDTEEAAVNVDPQLEPAAEVGKEDPDLMELIMASQAQGTSGVKGKTKIQNEEKQDALTQAKNKAQLTATSAMSVVQVALLREILKQGKDNNPFYYPVLVLIIISLVLQVLCGILALFVGHLKNFYKKYQDDLCDNITENICCCTVKFKKRRLRRKIKSRAEECVPGTVAATKSSINKQYFDDSSSDESDTQSGCWPFYVTTELHPKHEYEVLKKYDDWTSKLVQAELDAAVADIEVERFAARVQQLKDKLLNLENNKADYQVKLRDIQTQIKEAQRQREEYETSQMHLRIMNRQGEILHDHADDIRKDRVLKSASFWQNCLNYALYIVFVCNAFITGLGVVGTVTNSAES